jgi:iron complex outermembrane receptor protein
MKRILLFALLACLACATAATAQTDTMDLGEIVIVAPGADTASLLNDLPGATTVIQRADFDERQASLPELLEQTAGVEISSYGGLGSYSVASVRGSSAAQVLVLLDGIPLNQAFGGGVNLGNIPLNNVERIEVFRGNVPVRYHTSALGGVINIVTREPAGESAVKSEAGIGSFGTHYESLFLTRTCERWSHAWSGVLSGTRGDFRYTDDNGTTKTRRNNKNKALNLTWKAEFNGGPSERILITNNYFNKAEGVPGLGISQSQTASLSTQRHLTNVRLERDNYLFGHTNFAAELQVSWMRQGFWDPFDEVGAGSQDNNNTSRRLGLLTELSGEPVRNHFVTLVMQWSRERFSSFDTLDPRPVNGISERKTLTTSLEDQISLYNDRLLLTPSVRWETYENNFAPDPFDPLGIGGARSTDDDLVSGYMGARYKLNNTVTLRANGGRFHRMPSIYELFGDRGNIVGNSTLAPEQGNNYDAGAALDTMQLADTPGRFEVSYFQKEVKNLITFIQNTQRTARATNIGRAEIKGVEAALTLDPSLRWSLAANYTWQDTVDDSSVAFWRGNQLPGRHENQFNMHIKNRFGAGHSWYYQVSRDNGNFLDRANLKPVSPRNIQTLGLNLETVLGSINIEAKNFGNEQVSDIVGYPLPGKAIYVSIKRDLD